MNTIDSEAVAAEIVQWVRDVAAAGGEFVAAEAPNLVTEWLRWELVSSSARCLVAAVGALLCARLLARAVRGYRADPDRDDSRYPLLWIVSASWFVVLSLGSLTQALDAAKVIVAPRVVVVEKAADIVGVRP